MEDHNIVSRDEWIEARKQLLAKEKEFTRLRDQISQERRNLPWEVLDKQSLLSKIDSTPRYMS